MTESPQNQTERCALCDWPQEWDTKSELCILHSYDFMKFWEPLASFEGWSA